MKQCREHNCPLQDICRGAVDNETWWNISDNCEIFAFVNAQTDKIFALENRLKECENGYAGTLHLESCKLHDAERKIAEKDAEIERLKIEVEAMRCAANSFKMHFENAVASYMKYPPLPKCVDPNERKVVEENED